MGVLTELTGAGRLSEPQERRGVVREDAEAAPRPEPSRHHPGNDQEEGKEQEGAAASHSGDRGEEVGRVVPGMSKSSKLGQH